MDTFAPMFSSLSKSNQANLDGSDFSCILIGLESINDHKAFRGAIWIVVGIASALIGYYWPQIKQKLSKKEPHKHTQPEMVITSAPPQSLMSPVSVPIVVHPTGAQNEEREMVNVAPEYLTGFYKVHTSVQARKLAEAFMGKWMTVSGPLRDVLGNYENQRMVVFSNRSIYDNNEVNMYFRDKKRFGQLSTLKPGDDITVIGQLSDVNKVEIFLENCELVDS